MQVYWASVYMLPSSVIKDIESIFKRFSWNAGNVINGKARVAWKNVCRPKEQGGLGIKDMRKWNAVLIVRQFWKILENKESLWARWINIVKLKNRSIWEVQCDKYDSWGWKKMIEIRDMIKLHVFYEIGNGQSTSMWYDKWDQSGPLNDRISKRALYDARVDEGCRVADMIVLDAWKWPDGWIERYPSIRLLTVPIIQNYKEDKVLWVTNDNKKVDFSTKQAWLDLRDNWPAVQWSKVVWFPQLIPKHAFIFWLTIQGKLMTQDKMDKWHSAGVLHCSLCKKQPDNHAHLFFECHFARSVWKELQKCTYRMGMQNNMNSLVIMLADQKVKNGLGGVVNKLVLAAAVYYIWQERNARIFRKEERSVEILCKIIQENVRNKMMTIRVKKTGNVMQMTKHWNLCWKNSYLAAV